MLGGRHVLRGRVKEIVGGWWVGATERKLVVADRWGDKNHTALVIVPFLQPGLLYWAHDLTYCYYFISLISMLPKTCTRSIKHLAEVYIWRLKMCIVGLAPRVLTFYRGKWWCINAWLLHDPVNVWSPMMWWAHPRDLEGYEWRAW